MGDSNINSETAHLFEPLECSDKLGCASPEWTIPQTVKQRLVTAMRDSKKRIQFLLRRRIMSYTCFTRAGFFAKLVEFA
jgi:hypothetical protein